MPYQLSILYNVSAAILDIVAIPSVPIGSSNVGFQSFLILQFIKSTSTNCHAFIVILTKQFRMCSGHFRNDGHFNGVPHVDNR